jgi:hypothetical protein
MIIFKKKNGDFWSQINSLQFNVNTIKMSIKIKFE